MDEADAPYHAHIYYTPETRGRAETLRRQFREMMEFGAPSRLSYVGQLRDRKVGPHPIPQFEIHFTRSEIPAILPVIETSGLTALVHPLTDDDLADHTSLARWIGAPLALDLSVLDPPGVNQGVAQFGKAGILSRR